MSSKIGEKAETVASLRHTKDVLEREIGNAPFCVKVQTETIGWVEGGAETAAADSAAFGERQAAFAMLTLERDLLLEAMHRVKELSRKTRERIEGAEVLIANLRVSLDQKKLQADRADNLIHDCNQLISAPCRLIDTLSECV